MDSLPIIKLSDISYNYPGGLPALKKINFSFRKGERIGLLGHNGAGKTTLLHVIMGLIRPSSGTVEIFGKSREKESDFREVRERIGFLFQDADDQLFSPTVADDVAFGPLNLGKTHAEAEEITARTLKLLGLEGFADRITYKLSGGEKKLVSLATVLAMEPEILLLDEPFAGLDDKTSRRIVELLNKSDISYIMISHDQFNMRQTVNSYYKMTEGALEPLATPPPVD